jgi:hypothetical protein
MENFKDPPFSGSPSVERVEKKEHQRQERTAQKSGEKLESVVIPSLIVSPPLVTWTLEQLHTRPSRKTNNAIPHIMSLRIPDPWTASITGIIVYLGIVRSFRYRTLSYIKQASEPSRQDLKAIHDIFFRTVYVEFPFLSITSLSFGFLKTYAIPSISHLLAKTGELGDVKNVGRRYDDTEIIIREFAEHALDSDRATAGIGRMNALHSHYKIANRDYLYVLSVFVCESMRWIEKYGYRQLHRKEKEVCSSGGPHFTSPT